MTSKPDYATLLQQRDQLLAAHEKITKLYARGPHIGPEEAFEHALSKLKEARRISSAAIAAVKETDNG